jgi:broad specificity phosphatase PhoE
MAKLILVKHSLPVVERGVPASQWHLGEAGQRRCAALAAALDAYRPADIVCSQEPKAVETAARVAAAWGQPYTALPGLHEHRRERVGWLAGEAFEAAVQRFFEAPALLVLGEETALAAHERFTGAMADVIGQHPGRNLIVVAHGTVLALYAAAVAGVDGFGLWRRLGLPSFVVFEQAGGPIERVVESVEAWDGA